MGSLRIRKDIIYKGKLKLNKELTIDHANKLNPYHLISPLEDNLLAFDPIASTVFSMDPEKETMEILFYKNNNALYYRIPGIDIWQILCEDITSVNQLNKHKILLLGTLWFDILEVEALCSREMLDLIDPD